MDLIRKDFLKKKFEQRAQWIVIIHSIMRSGDRFTLKNANKTGNFKVSALKPWHSNHNDPTNDTQTSTTLICLGKKKKINHLNCNAFSSRFLVLHMLKFFCIRTLCTVVWMHFCRSNYNYVYFSLASNSYSHHVCLMHQVGSLLSI